MKILNKHKKQAQDPKPSIYLNLKNQKYKKNNQQELVIKLMMCLFC